MRKIFTLSLTLALCASVNAETIKLLGLGLGVPGMDEPQLIGLGISPDGKYVCGSLEMGQGLFVADTQSGDVRYDMSEDPEGAELRHVDNNGLAIGYDGPGITYSINGTMTVLPTPTDEYSYVLGEDLSNDGSIKVGSLVISSYFTIPAVSKNNGEWTPLPMPSAEILGIFAEDGGAAKYVSGDGKVIVGYAGSWGPTIIWTMNDAGEYEVNPIFAEYVAMTEEEVENSSKPLLGMLPANVSDNGKYVVSTGTIQEIIDDEYSEIRNVVVVYDVEEHNLTIYNELQEIDEYGFGLNPTAIANDGTVIGVIGQPMIGASGNFIIKPGETQAESFAEAFPEYNAIFGVPDSIGYCVAPDMSADGRYILGYGFYSEDFNDLDAPAYFQTFIIDRGDVGTGVGTIDTDSQEAKPEAFYTIDGKRLDRMTKGLNIVRMSDGSVRKILK